MATPRPLDLISIVLPVYNEAAVLPLLLPRLDELLTALPAPAEILFVNDGSSDDSAALLDLAARNDPRIRIVHLSRNFGHQIAITAGTDLARGDAVVVMDADLQDPPDIVPLMIAKYREGFDVVYGQRTSRPGESWLKRATARWFYRLMRSSVHQELPDSVGDFRLMSRQVTDALSRMRERHRFLRGMVTWLGFTQVAIPFERAPRAAGETKFPLRRMLSFAWDAITSFSGLPLRIGLGIGVLLTCGAVLYGIYAIAQALVFHNTVPGWASLVCLLVGLCGMIIVMLGLVGEYVARIYEEIKDRPLYLVKSLTNFSEGVEAQKSLERRPFH